MEILNPKRSLFIDGLPIYHHAATMRPMSIFGHIALTIASHRTATIVSKEPSHLLSLEKVYFTQICTQIGNEVEDLMNFLRLSLPGLNNEHLANLVSKLREKKYRMGHRLIKIGENPKFCYLVKSGEVTVLYCI